MKFWGCHFTVPKTSIADLKVSFYDPCIDCKIFFVMEGHFAGLQTLFCGFEDAILQSLGFKIIEFEGCHFAGLRTSFCWYAILWLLGCKILA